MAKKIEDAIREAEGSCRERITRVKRQGSQSNYIALGKAYFVLNTLRAAQARGETTVPEDGE